MAGLSPITLLGSRKRRDKAIGGLAGAIAYGSFCRQREPRMRNTDKKSIAYPFRGLPPAQGLYDPDNERDNCGVGFVANIEGHKSHDIVLKGIQILINLTHRGACGCDPQTGDGAGVLI